jgi:hypothetical protein
MCSFYQGMTGKCCATDIVTNMQQTQDTPFTLLHGSQGGVENQTNYIHIKMQNQNNLKTL